MSDHEHKHPSSEPADADAPAQVANDPAMRSLSESLRLSFGLLRVLMVLFVILFLLTGIKTIKSNEVGIVKLFGRKVDVAGEGLVYNWPFPIGEIEVVDVSQEKLTVSNFWMYESPSDIARPLEQRSRRNEGLEPGRDGALLTGDRYFVHMKIQCTYGVQDAFAVASRVTDLPDLLHQLICDAAVRAAATRTAEDIRGEPEMFLADIRGDVQADVDELIGPNAVQIDNILVAQLPGGAVAVTWPLAASDAYEAAQAAQSERDRRIDEAVSEARQMAKVIGETYFVQLAGRPWDRDRYAEQQMTQAGKDEEGRPYNLIGQLTDVRDRIETLKRRGESEQLAALQAQADSLRQQIDDILTRADIGGEVSEIIRTADADRTAVIQRAQRRAQQFGELLAQYRQAPDVFLHKLWSQAYDEVISQPTNTKYYLAPGPDGRTVLRINPDPEVLRQMLDYQWDQKRADARN